MRRLFPITLLVLCILSLFIALQLANSLKTHKVLREELKRSELLLAQAQRQYSEALRKARIYNRIQRFLHTAKLLGLEKDKWHSYEVMVKEPMSFSEVREILEQCASKEGLFFEPMYLSINKKKREEEEEGSPQRGNGGDLFFEMKGRFLVRIK